MFEIILIVLLFGSWMCINDISFTFASAIQTGSIRFRVMTVILLISLSIGFIICRSSSWTQYEENWNISSPIVGTILAFSASLAMFLLRKNGPVNSICYAIYGAILGWEVFNHVNEVYTSLFPLIIVWILAPLICGGITCLLYRLIQSITRKGNIHLLYLNICFRVGIIIAITLMSISIGANNGPLFMAIVRSQTLDFGLDFGLFSLDDQSLLWIISIFILALSMAIPVKRKILSYGNNITDMNIVSVFTILIGGSIVLFFFNHPWACGSIGLPVTSVSPVHAVIGGMTGISIARRRKNALPLSLPIRMGISILGTPALAFGIAHTLFQLIDLPGLMQRNEVGTSPEQMINMTIPLISILFISFILFVGFSFRHQQVKRIQAQNALKEEQHQRFEAQQVLISMELKTIQLENERLNTKLEIKRKELVDLALDISEQRKFFDGIFQEIKRIQSIDDLQEIKTGLEDIAQTISSRMTFSNEMSGFYTQVEELHKNFITKLQERFPDITEQEKRLATLLRLGFSTKDIAGLMNISPKSVEIGRYRLRKKLELTREDNLIQYIKSL
ncbi:LuxR C-terminal-related transcriptional regulator [Butyricimonas faecalis]|nr:LuxR C-terminal-related transcriptional regulator [Butyricimonas faecalis]